MNDCLAASPRTLSVLSRPYPYNLDLCGSCTWGQRPQDPVPAKKAACNLFYCLECFIRSQCFSYHPRIRVKSAHQSFPHFTLGLANLWFFSACVLCTCDKACPHLLKTDLSLINNLAWNPTINSIILMLPPKKIVKLKNKFYKKHRGMHPVGLTDE